MTRTELLATMCLVAMMAACGEERGTASGTDLASAPRWTAEEMTRIGSVDDPEQALMTVGPSVIGPEGELYLSQPGDGEIRVYDSEGHLIRTIGRGGEGPGEFSFIGDVGLKGDTLYVTDYDLGRVSFFSLDGQVLGTTSWHTSEDSRPAANNPGVILAHLPTPPQVFLSDGTALARILTSPFSTSGSRLSGPFEVPFVHIDARGAVIDTLVGLPTRMTVLRVDDNGSTSYYGARYFEDEPLGALLPNGRGVVVVNRTIAVTGKDATLGVTLIGISGDTVFAHDFVYAPRAVSDEVLAQIARDLHDSREDGPDASVIERALRDSGLIPPALPPVTALKVRQDGSIWLRREDVPGDSVLWNVFDADGELRGAVQLPRRDRVIAARGDLVAATELGEFDVPYVVTYRLDRN